MAKRKLPKPTSSAISKDERGFSLIEILVVVGMMALITGVFIPSLTGAFRVKGESVARKIGLILGQTRDRALLTNHLIRLKVDFERQVLTLEEAKGDYLVPKIPDGILSEREKEELEKKEAEIFRPVTELMSEPMQMPNGLKIIQLTSPRYKKPLTEGVGAIYFFGNGSADGATIYFETDEKVKQAVVLHPVTGMVRVENRGPEEAR